MAFVLYIIFSLVCNGVFATNNDPSTSTSGDKNTYHGNRDGKLFSLFSIVQFKNEACTSAETLSNTAGTVSRNGTCYSSTECRDKSGRASGGCAAGFGVCCVFVYETSGSTISQNCSYIRNPNYPNAYTDTNSLQFTVVKCDPSVCYLRLDFENFDVNGLTASTEFAPAGATGSAVACTDKFTITSVADPGLPEICGKNPGQHVYVDIGTGASDSATLNFDFTNADTLSNTRFFEIKVTQLPCSNEYNRFPGCFQYHEGLTGRVETFNYQNCLNAQSHLPSQDYSICVRPEAGYDCVRWQVCPDQPCGQTIGNGITLPAVDTACVGYSIGAAADSDKPVAPAKCTGDKIRINGASEPCCQGSNPTPVVDAMCGFFFTVNVNAANQVQAPVCDCVAPYNIDIEFDADGDLVGTMALNTESSCGLCLIYDQVKC